MTDFRRVHGPMGPVAMRVDYDQIARRYDDHRGGGGPYMDRLQELAAECRAGRVLELGAGTGNNTQAFLGEFPCSLVALERSAGMLSQGRAKGLPVHWLRASADAIPLADASVSFVFGVYILHHLSDLAGVFRECARVMGHGYTAFVTASTSFIQRHPMNRYFPSFAQVDMARFQPVESIEEAFRMNGFIETAAEYFMDKPRPIDEAYVERVAGKFISTYDLLPEGEFEAGLARLRADVAVTGQLDIPIVWESAIVWGRR